MTGNAICVTHSERGIYCVVTSPEIAPVLASFWHSRRSRCAQQRCGDPALPTTWCGSCLGCKRLRL